jgi:hypothetical protein
MLSVQRSCGLIRYHSSTSGSTHDSIAGERRGRSAEVCVAFIRSPPHGVPLNISANTEDENRRLVCELRQFRAEKPMYGRHRRERTGAGCDVYPLSHAVCGRGQARNEPGEGPARAGPIHLPTLAEVWIVPCRARGTGTCMGAGPRTGLFRTRTSDGRAIAWTSSRPRPAALPTSSF